ncbi:MAG: type II toxin-antitoxin system VapC family toxin [Deltaproteobacteria bacterium]|nr:type II toxin-antitoxin system VapC family toxin [Deltaproteobacteria bacterium]
MNYLLDTCIISELIKKTPEKRVVGWIGGCDEECLFLSVLTLGEIQKGIVKLSDKQRRTRLQGWLDQDLKNRFEGRILPVNAETSRVWGMIQAQSELQGRKIPVVDALIAATALANNLTVATRNRADMEKSGVAVFNPWELPA